MNIQTNNSKFPIATLALVLSLMIGSRGMAYQAVGDPPPASPPPTESEKKQDQDSKAPPSLDDLLGLDDEDKTDSAEDAARREIEEELQRELNEKEIRDAFKIAVEKMDLSAELLDEKFDPGLGTQRIQEDIIAKLQQLINQAKKQKSSKGSSSSSQNKQKPQDEKQKPGKQDGQKKNAGSSDSKSPQDSQAGASPPPQDASLNSMIEESRTEWGHLPERIRSMLLQGRKGKYSSLYDKMTSEYYKRLAEDNPR